MKVEITWHNVKYGNPKYKGYYLVTTATGSVCECFYNPKCKKFVMRNDYDLGNVIAWAEMPKGFTE